MTNSNPTLGFIGGGNMAAAIIGGLVSAGWSGDQIHVSDPVEASRNALHARFGIAALDDNAACVAASDVVVIAVKPQLLRQVIEPLAAQLQQSRPLLISIVAGIRSQDTLAWIGTELPFARVMPNTPALVNQGVSGLWVNHLVSEQQAGIAETVMQAVGKVVRVDSEDQIDAVTGVSGSGPAYFFKIMEVMMQSATDHGLPDSAARSLVIETALGAATLISQSSQSPAELRRQVTSPAGTTEAGIRAMEAAGIDQAIAAGVDAAVLRSAELAQEFGGS